MYVEADLAMKEPWKPWVTATEGDTKKWRKKTRFFNN
jgi:hypothetical protein